MFVNRLTYNTKLGKVEKAAELQKESLAMNPAPHGSRLYTIVFGPFSKLVLELEFENSAEMEDYWERFWSLPENPEFIERWYETVDAGGSNEIWQLVD